MDSVCLFLYFYPFHNIYIYTYFISITSIIYKVFFIIQDWVIYGIFCRWLCLLSLYAPTKLILSRSLPWNIVIWWNLGGLSYHLWSCLVEWSSLLFPLPRLVHLSPYQSPRRFWRPGCIMVVCCHAWNCIFTSCVT